MRFDQMPRIGEAIIWDREYMAMMAPKKVTVTVRSIICIKGHREVKNSVNWTEAVKENRADK
jgi:hypothetical protein